ncbi:MAG: A24 family peptidase [Anaerolineae bacterium]
MSLLYALLGLLVGAFLNLCADRLPEHRSILTYPFCPYCQRERDPLGWVSVLAYALLRGRCQHCGAPYPLRAPLMELAMALIFAFLGRRYGLSLRFLFVALYACAYILVFVTDLEHRLIPNTVIYPAMLLALGGSLLGHVVETKSALIGGAIGFSFFYVVALVYPGGMGGGDVKLAGFIGLVTGFPNVISALVMGIFVGGFVAFFLLITRLKGLKSSLPYGPFLVVGGLAILLFGKEIGNWLLAHCF